MSMSQNLSYIIFSKNIDVNSTQRLMDIILREIQSGKKAITLLISSPGGHVSPGISIYNFLKGIPIEIITHTFGQADSMAVVLFCAGSKRYCTPDSRYLIHGIGFNTREGQRFDERSLKEKVEALKNERETISKIISDNSDRSLKDIEADMLRGVVWTPEKAMEYGLVHEIRGELFPKGAHIIKI